MKTETETIRKLQYNRKTRFKKKSEPYVYLLPTVLLMIILLVIPIFMVIRYSFFDNVIINKNPEFIGFSNFKEVLANKSFLTAVKNTSIFVGFSIVAHMILGMTFAMVLNTKYLGTKTKAIFRVIFALPWMFTAAVIAILWKLLLNPNGLINYFLIEFNLTSNQIEWLASRDFALLSVTMINIWAGYPFFMISILAGLQGIRSELYESAAIDGANSIKSFFHITIPQLKPILISLILLDFVWTIQQFALIWMTTGGGPIDSTEILSTFIYKQGFTRYEYSLASTSAVILLIICTIVSIFYVRHQRGRE
ncbi:carbohydrate ABC transporter permease [Bacillus sp. D386]|uniref:carbohydrate ABC transporter permease n=1 Tax=Bacillus sp. D386 TaxID=2587155 RepID=UPI00214C2D85|nr:sugar ABC transporter permease [Bacillus sp. D386]